MLQSGRQYRYQEPNATMTLREGHAEYCEANDLLDPQGFDNPKVGELFACHDHCHIVFGTNTDIVQEGMTDFWTIWGADVGWKGYLEYAKEPATKQIIAELMQQFSAWQIVSDQARSLPYYWRVWRHARRMRKKWEFRNYEAWLDLPLVDIRREFGIELVEPPPVRHLVTAEMPPTRPSVR